MKTLILAESNAMNQLIVKDNETWLARYIDHDLSEEEINAYIEKFKADGDLEDIYGGEFEPVDYDEVKENFIGCHDIA